MKPVLLPPSRHAGFSMVEVLMTLLIILLGLMGIAGLIARMQQAEFESYQRAQALILMHDMVDRIHLHKTVASCFRFTTDTAAGTPFLGVGSSGAPACAASTANDNTQGDLELAAWNSLLQGASETKSGASVGAMVGARGCVSYDSTTELLDAGGAVMSGTGIYTVVVTWQGTNDGVAPTVNCANSSFSSATRRRAVSTSFRMAFLR